MSDMQEYVKGVAGRTNKLLECIAEVRRESQRHQAQLDAQRQVLQQQYGTKIEACAEQEKRLVDELVGLVEPNFDLLALKGTKTIKFRAGEISLRTNAPALEVTDPAGDAAVIRRIRRHGGLRKFTTIGARSLNKNALKAAPDFVTHIRGIEIVRRTNMVIKPAETQGEIIRTSDKFSVTLTTEGG